MAVGFFITGWRRGFVRMAGGLISLAVSIVAGVWGITWLEDVIGIPFSSHPIGLVFAFLMIAVLAGTVVNLLIGALDLVRRLFSVVPGVGLLNHLGGSAVGLLEAAVVVLGVSYLSVHFITDATWRALLLASQGIGYGIRTLSALGWI
jgi:Colicin V production protein